MNYTALVSALIAGLIIAPVAQASFDLARKSSCMSCHMIDKRILGPSFQEVAAKYAGQDNAHKILAEKVKKGGKGVWGEIPMPPNGHVKDADLDTLIKWILSGAAR